MSIPTPVALSPTKISDFGICGLQFQLKHLERLPEPPTDYLDLGNLVHEALEHLYFKFDPPERTLEQAMTQAGLASGNYPTADCAIAAELAGNLWQVEDPNAVTVMGCEVRVEGLIGGAPVRGIIDRIDIEEDGIVLVDYKTGKPPRKRDEGDKMRGLQAYAILFEQLTWLPVRRLKLIYLQKPVVITHTVVPQVQHGVELRVEAMWKAIQESCERDYFAPRVSALCSWCTWQGICPAWRDA